MFREAVINLLYDRLLWPGPLPFSSHPPCRFSHIEYTANTVEPSRYRGIPVCSGVLESRSHSQPPARVSSIWPKAVGIGLCCKARQTFFHEVMGRCSATESRQRPDKISTLSKNIVRWTHRGIGRAVDRCGTSRARKGRVGAHTEQKEEE